MRKLPRLTHMGFAILWEVHAGSTSFPGLVGMVLTKYDLNKNERQVSGEVSQGVGVLIEQGLLEEDDVGVLSVSQGGLDAINELVQFYGDPVVAMGYKRESNGDS